MTIQFYKYQGTGNDFILLDNRKNQYNELNTAQIKNLCDRHFGIGADGLMLINQASTSDIDFEMKYYNSDGRESTMCGNGGRCITLFAKDLHLINETAHFRAIDGIHEANIEQDSFIRLKMCDVSQLKIFETFFQLNTGSPHYVHFNEDTMNVDMKKEGALIRYSPLFKEDGINVNFVKEISENEIFVRTYERGVEDETLSCGTGVTASAIAHKQSQNGHHHVFVKTLGGNLSVTFDALENQFQNVWLSGEAKFVFTGTIES
ncbi:MAG: diaminopimelate epimerase [Chitinophagaceae bacterium]|nr:MAG: diaminopimelate epimerase [Bacteroidetes bacterium OLB11]MCC6448639.1 diaminopimelate epimerase [Chitinophagaceae bacterium]HMN33546.1 diaminopimelate epimerase [Chitinophagaceae bacterium]